QEREQGKREHDGYRAGEDEGEEGEPQRLSDVNVLWVADGGERAPQIACCGERQEVREGIAPRAQERAGEERRQREADHVVGEHGGEQSGGEDGPEEQSAGAAGLGEPVADR